MALMALHAQVDSERGLPVQMMRHLHQWKEPSPGTQFCYDSLRQVQHKGVLEEFLCQQALTLLRLMLSRVLLLEYYGQHGKKNLWWLPAELAVPMDVTGFRRLSSLPHAVEACAMVLAKEA